MIIDLSYKGVVSKLNIKIKDKTILKDKRVRNFILSRIIIQGIADQSECFEVVSFKTRLTDKRKSELMRKKK
jgi:hypothetical protein